MLPVSKVPRAKMRVKGLQIPSRMSLRVWPTREASEQPTIAASTRAVGRAVVPAVRVAVWRGRTMGLARVNEERKRKGRRVESFIADRVGVDWAGVGVGRKDEDEMVLLVDGIHLICHLTIANIEILPSDLPNYAVWSKKSVTMMSSVYCSRAGGRASNKDSPEFPRAGGMCSKQPRHLGCVSIQMCFRSR